MSKTNGKKVKSRTRRWVFTLNNPQGEINEFIETLTSKVAVRYVVVGKEYAPTTNTLHWQGFVEFENAATFEQMKARMPSAHVEAAKGSNRQNRDYCTKSNDYIEFGKISERRQVSDEAAQVVALLLDGLKVLEILREYPETSAYIVNHYRALRDIENDCLYEQKRVDNLRE